MPMTLSTILAISIVAFVGAMAGYVRTLVHERRLNAQESERFRAAR